jgi:hypothetical protein
MNYRTQATVATIENDGTDTTVDFFNLNDNAYASDAKDDLSIEFATEFAGASVTMQPSVKTGTLALGLGGYHGWIRFGSFNLTAGAFDSRFTSRVSGFAGNYNGIVGEYVKFGGLKDTTMILDADNFGTAMNVRGADADGNQANRIHSLIADYTFNVGEKDKLLVKFGLQEGANIALDDSGDMNWAPTNISLGYTSSAFGTFEGIFRLLAKDKMVFGAYARSNKLVDNLDAALGFTMGMDVSGATMATEMGIDVRAQYTMGALLLATNMNFTKYTSNEWGMWIAGSANYKFNDWFTGRATVSYIDEEGINPANDQLLSGLLGAEFIAMKNCSISTGVEARYDLAGEELTVFVPLILRVRF